MEAVTQICFLPDPVDTHLGLWEDVVDKSKPVILQTKLFNMMSLNLCLWDTWMFFYPPCLGITHADLSPNYPLPFF